MRVQLHASTYLNDLCQSKSTANAPSESPPGVAACMVVVNNDADEPIVRMMSGVGGVRTGHTYNECSLYDKWHLGSDGKAMASMLVALAVQQGLLTWDTTLRDCEGLQFLISDSTVDQYLDNTILDFLTHMSGFPTLDDETWSLCWSQHHQNEQNEHACSPRKQRETVLSKFLTVPSNGKGSFEYSNFNYMMAAYLLEVLLDQDYESMIIQRLFKPLGITTYGFGMPSAATPADHPQGHGAQSDWTASNDDNPKCVTPAGRMHMTINDWGRFIAVTLSPSLCLEVLGISRETYNTLYTPGRNGEYCPGGWVKVQRGWATDSVYNHNGSNTFNHCTAWLAPSGPLMKETRVGEQAFAILCCTNHGLGAAADSVVGNMIKGIDKVMDPDNLERLPVGFDYGDKFGVRVNKIPAVCAREKETSCCLIV